MFTDLIKRTWRTIRGNPIVWLFAIIMVIPDPKGQPLLSISLTLVLAYIQVIALSALIRIGASYPNPHSDSFAELIKLPIGAAIRLLILDFIASLLVAPAMIFIYQMTIFVTNPTEIENLPNYALMAAIILIPLSVPFQLAERHFVIADPSLRAAIRSGWSLTTKNFDTVFAGYGLAFVLSVLCYPLAGILVLMSTSFLSSSITSLQTLVVRTIFLTSVLLFPFVSILGTHTYLKITSQKSMDELNKSTNWLERIINWISLIFIACVSAVATTWLSIIVFVIYSFIDGIRTNDPEAGMAAQGLVLCLVVWPIAVVAGSIFLLATYLLFKKSFRKHPVLFSIIAGALGGLMPFCYLFIYSLLNR